MTIHRYSKFMRDFIEDAYAVISQNMAREYQYGPPQGTQGLADYCARNESMTTPPPVTPIPPGKKLDRTGRWGGRHFQPTEK